MGSKKYKDGFSSVRTHPVELLRPERWRKPRRIFICSMSDLFHPDVPDNFIVQVLDTCAHADWHTFQVLTKRPERAASMWNLDWPSNVWFGISAEHGLYFHDRCEALRHVDAALRFVSFEPLVYPVREMDDIDLNTIDWAIVGGETGPGARPMDPDWARSIRDQCAAAGVPFFMKQMARGEPIPDDLMIREFPGMLSA